MKTSGISEGFHQSSIFNMKNTEKQIADAIAKASGLSVTALGLRFDKVVRQPLSRLSSFLC
jgi:hypothetical protein